MRLCCSFILAFGLLPLQVQCQTVQDDWTAPSAPGGSTPLQSGSKFTLLWKSGLQNSFKAYCPSCDTTKLDLWIINFNGTVYKAKIGRGVDVTTSSSYDWNVDIASDAFSSQDFWIFRFTFFDSVDPYTQQISSPGFKISGLVKASSTVTVQSSSATSTSRTSSRIATTSTTPTTAASSSIVTTPATVASSDTGTPQSTSTPSSSSKNHTWISGVVLGPLVGIALGAALMWICLRKRKSKKAQQNQAPAGHGQDGYYQQYLSGHDPKESYSHTVTSNPPPWQHDTGQNDQHIAEAPGTMSPRQEPAELWQGNYRTDS